MGNKESVCYVIVFQGEDSLLPNLYQGCVDVKNDDTVPCLGQATQFETKEEAEKAKEEYEKKHEEGLGYFDGFSIGKLTVSNSKITLEME